MGWLSKGKLQKSEMTSEAMVLTDCSWDKGLLDMCIGEKRTLTIAPSYGYGHRSVGPIPAGSTLGMSSEKHWPWSTPCPVSD